MPVNPEYALLQDAAAALNESERLQLAGLLRRHGIAGEYIEYSGQVAHIPLSDQLDILSLQGVDLFNGSVLDQDRLQKHARQLAEEPWQSPLPPVLVLSPGGRESVCVRLPQSALNLRWQWQLQSESGVQFSASFVPAELDQIEEADIDGVSWSARELHLPPFHSGALEPGYHRLSLLCLEASAASGVDSVCSVPLMVAPRRGFEPQWLLDERRLWGFSVQLYSLRSPHNWGIGDFADLQQLIRLAAQQGAGFLVLNPLHALDMSAPANCSPYSPNDRRRLNLLYIDPTQEVDFQECDGLQLMTTSGPRLDTLRECAAIDYPAVAALKLEVLARMFRHFLVRHLQAGTERAAAYIRFVAGQGESLQVFASFESGRLQACGSDCADPRFTLYTQWLAETQLERCQTLSRELGMPIGLIRDLAVGGDGGGAEVSLNADLFCTRASIGAPPDPLAPQGQNWGLPPLDPLRLHDNAYRHFIELLRSNMAHCGALRIDHVMALMRLWWCPRYPGRGVGAYVHYPVDDLFALLRLESMRNRCLVIGEDLGVVPPEVRAYLNASAVFSNVLFYFEKYDGYHFKRPEHYNPRALAMVANHDVPTLAAWWNCSDLLLRHQLGLIATELELLQQKQWRQSEKQQVLRWLGEQWLLPPGWQGDIDLQARPFDAILCAAIFRCSARSSSQLVSVQLEDLALLETPVNIPGTSSEYPNWRRKLPIDLQELLASESGRTLLAGFAAERGVP